MQHTNHRPWPTSPCWRFWIGALASAVSSLAVAAERNSIGIPKGIPAFQETTIDYSQPGKPKLKVQLGEPVVVAVASRPEKWGFFQFPRILRGEKGMLRVSWSMHADSIHSYGKGGSSNAVSSDGGKTWASSADWRGRGGLVLPNGDRISVATPKPLRCEDLNLPESVGSVPDTYIKQQLPLYRIDELPAELQGIRLNRISQGKNQWEPETADLVDPQALRYSSRSLFPIIWWGDMHVAPDNSILAVIFPGYYLRDDGALEPKRAVFCYRSTDNGHSWHIQGRIPYRPDLETDPQGDERRGFHEPAFTILPNGVCLCVMRTTDGLGIGPMYASTSKDLGKTWSQPEIIAPAGVRPHLLCLENGIVVLSSGRPGVQVRFCADGKGKTWTDAFEMLPFQNEDNPQAATCGYTGLLATGPDRFMLVYSDFQHKDPEGQDRKAILLREITVARQ